MNIRTSEDVRKQSSKYSSSNKSILLRRCSLKCGVVKIMNYFNQDESYSDATAVTFSLITFVLSFTSFSVLIDGNKTVL